MVLEEKFSEVLLKFRKIDPGVIDVGIVRADGRLVSTFKQEWSKEDINEIMESFPKIYEASGGMFGETKWLYIEGSKSSLILYQISKHIYLLVFARKIANVALLFILCQETIKELTDIIETEKAIVLLQAFVDILKTIRARCSEIIHTDITSTLKYVKNSLPDYPYIRGIIFDEKNIEISDVDKLLNSIPREDRVTAVINGMTLFLKNIVIELKKSIENEILAPIITNTFLASYVNLRAVMYMYDIPSEKVSFQW